MNLCIVQFATAPAFVFRRQVKQHVDINVADNLAPGLGFFLFSCPCTTAFHSSQHAINSNSLFSYINPSSFSTENAACNRKDLEEEEEKAAKEKKGRRGKNEE